MERLRERERERKRGRERESKSSTKQRPNSRREYDSNVARITPPPWVSVTAHPSPSPSPSPARPPPTRSALPVPRPSRRILWLLPPLSSRCARLEGRLRHPRPHLPNAPAPWPPPRPLGVDGVREENRVEASPALGQGIKPHARSSEA